MHHLRAAGGLLFLLCIAPLAARGAVTTYTNRTTFNAAAGPVVVEGYEDESVNLAFPSTPQTFSDFSVSMFGTLPYGVNDEVNATTGRFPSAGDHYFDTTFSSTQPCIVTFTFPQPITAFGSDIVDLENSTLTYSIDSSSYAPALGSASNGSIQFWGAVSDTPFTTIAFRMVSSSSDVVIFDQTAYAVPEPATGCIALLTIAGMTTLQRCRDRRIQ